MPVSPGASDPLKSIADDISAAFGDLISSNQMTVRGNELWVEIELNSSLLFGSGDAMPSDIAFNIIDKVAAILKPFDNPIHVEGFTDDQPIRTAQYPTNWELSSARSASIVRMLAMQGVNPGRLASVGYGEFQPVANNATAEGRARNRRVVLVVSRNLDVRRSLTGTGTANATTGCRVEACWHTNCTDPGQVAGTRERRQFSVTRINTLSYFSVDHFDREEQSE